MENNEEQPIINECNSLENSNLNVDIENNGSSLGKFKNADELFKAYSNLEKEFTKKCQKLKELEAANDNTDNSPACADNEKSVPESMQKISSESRQKTIKELLETPVASANNDTLSQIINDTMYHNAEKNVSLDERDRNCVLNSEDECVNINLSKPLSDGIKELIYSNAEIRNKVIENYLNDIQSQKAAPLMVNTVSSNFCIMPKTKPQNFNDAGERFKEMLNN